ncbi:MAG: cysteine synthase A [Clostridia bacterium]|nr:cysteine synthase A [Clostridia bacterium]
MKIFDDISALVGATPLMRLERFEKQQGIEAAVLAKLEYFNPGGSVKDRVALHIIEQAEKEGRLIPGSVIIEPTSGNTGIGLAMVAAAKGYKVILTMPESMSLERRQLLSAYGAELVLTPAAEGMSGAVKKAEEIAAATANSFIAGQFTNPDNPQAHYLSTGPEIYADTDGNVDIFVASIGTGGTISGTAKYLKEKNPDIKIIGVEPASSPLLTKGVAGAHKIQGIGANFVPDTLNRDIIDEIIAVSDDRAYEYARLVAKAEGCLVGISSGAALAAACEIASKTENKGKNIVVLLPDSGSRYLSSGVFE